MLQLNYKVYDVEVCFERWSLKTPKKHWLRNI